MFSEEDCWELRGEPGVGEVGARDRQVAWVGLNSWFFNLRTIGLLFLEGL